MKVLFGTLLAASIALLQNVFGTLLVAFITLQAPPANAESLLCNGHSASEGDTKLSVAYKCGQPLLKDTYCAPVYVAPSIRPVPEPFAGAVVPCQPVEAWLYDRGPGNLAATVRFRDGIVQSITYGRSPQ
jgi:hypothetical protein